MMRTGKGNREEEEYRDDEFGSKREGSSLNATAHRNNNFNPDESKDVKSSDRARTIRSKHSVTEQKRRSKINERFQILRELIPNSHQKRDTASFLLEVIECVQNLQEKVHKYEGSCPGWSPEPTKLMPWRNSHWRLQGNGSGPGLPFPGNYEESSNMIATPASVSGMQNLDESDAGKDRTVTESRPEQSIPQMVHGMSDEDLIIEGGTINISSVYSHELLSSLTHALQRTGIDLSEARLSLQIDLGKQPSDKDPSFDNHGDDGQHMVPTGEDESDQCRKRVRT